MKYRPLGKTGLMVSEIGLGAEWLERHTAQECQEVIDLCDQSGINIIDVWMSEPNVRSKIGAALRGKRDHWIIEGQLCSYWDHGKHTTIRDLPRVKESLADLLTRLQTDYLDIGMIHYVDTQEVYDQITRPEFVEYLLSLKRQGVLRHLGVSTHNPATAKLAAQSGLFEVILFSINPAFDMLPPTEDMGDYFVKTYREELFGIAPERTELYTLCEELGVGITVMKAYAGGRLFRAEASPFGTALTPTQCIHYALTRPGVGSVLVGLETPQQVAEALAYETADEQQRDYTHTLANAPFHAFSGQCTYCGHCQPCPAGIDIALLGKLQDLAEMQNELPSSLREHYRALSVKAGACLQCGGCETRCPFGVPIMERMKRAQKLFGE